MNNAATPTKLRNGSWGVRVQGAARKGDTVTVTARSGKTWTASITKVIWSGNGVSICATGSSGSKPAYRRRASNGECRCGACDDLLSFGCRPGQRVRCEECGGWAEAC